MQFQFFTRILMLAGSLSAAFAQTGRPAGLTPEQVKVDKIVHNLIKTHPVYHLAEYFKQWKAQRAIYIAYQSRQMPNEMSTVLADVGGRIAPVLVINPRFILDETLFFRKEDRDDYKRLVIYHEYAHIMNHLSGNIPLQRAAFDPKDASFRAQNIWDSEWAAVEAEWQLAKQIGKPYLVSFIHDKVKLHGEKKGFLIGFYEILSAGANVKGGLHLIKPVWDQIFAAKMLALQQN